MAKCLDRVRDRLLNLERLCGSGGGSPGGQGDGHAVSAERGRELEGGYHRDRRALIWLGVLTVSLTLAFAAVARDGAGDDQAVQLLIQVNAGA